MVPWKFGKPLVWNKLYTIIIWQSSQCDFAAHPCCYYETVQIYNYASLLFRYTERFDYHLYIVIIMIVYFLDNFFVMVILLVLMINFIITVCGD